MGGGGGGGGGGGAGGGGGGVGCEKGISRSGQMVRGGSSDGAVGSRSREALVADGRMRGLIKPYYHW